MATTESYQLLIDKAKEFLFTKTEIIRLKWVGKSTDVISLVMVKLFLLVVGMISLIFFSIACALIMAKLSGSYELGFSLVGGFYAILLFILYIGRNKWLKKPVADGLVTKM